MGAISIVKNDFVGQYQLPRTTATDPVLQSYIDREYTKTLYKLLGKELADLLIAYNAITQTAQTVGPLVIGTEYYITTYVAGDDFTNVGGTNVSGTYFVATGTTPTTWTNASSLINKTERYENLINPFYLESNLNYVGGPYYDSTGIKDLLLICIYYAYISEVQMRITQSGVSFSQGENSSVQSGGNAYRLGEQKFNNAGLSTWLAIRWYCLSKYPTIYPEYAGINERSRYSGLM